MAATATVVLEEARSRAATPATRRIGRTGWRLPPKKTLRRAARPSLGLSSVWTRRSASRREKPGFDQCHDSTARPADKPSSRWRKPEPCGQRRQRNGDGGARTAAHLVDRHRILLSATEARAGVSSLLTRSPAWDARRSTRKGDRHRLDQRSGGHRCESVQLHGRRERLAADLVELRGIVREMDQMTLAGEDTSEAVAEAKTLERRTMTYRWPGASCRHRRPEVASSSCSTPWGHVRR